MGSVQRVVQAIQSIPSFQSGTYLQRIHDSARTLPLIKKHLKVRAVGGTTDTSAIDTVIDGKNQKSIIESLAVQTVVSVIGSMDDTVDKADFRACVKKYTAEKDMEWAMDQLTAFLFAEHIDHQLRQKNSPNLLQLSKEDGFLEAFSEQLSDVDFINSEIKKDFARGDHLFSLSLLFILEYVQHGPGFVPFRGDDFKSSRSCAVLTRWASQLLNTDKATIAQVFRFSVIAASLVAMPVDDSGKGLIPTISKLRRLVQHSSFERALGEANRSHTGVSKSLTHLPDLDNIGPEDLESLDLQAYESIEAVNISNWNGYIRDNWIAAVGTEATEQTRRERQIGGNTAERRPVIVNDGDVHPNVERWEITTVVGKDLDNWIDDAKGRYTDLFTGKSASVPTDRVVENRTRPRDNSGGCFLAGTKVATSRGDINIEHITEGTQILAEASMGRCGVSSDEEVEKPLTDPLLCGFNGGDTFSTLGHVFHTTTGLRAVDPDVAMKENHWMDVGQLREGHVLYRLSADRTSYDIVPIKSIEVKVMPGVHKVYGIHLREGERRYHANGFLVAASYPEITVKSVTRALQRIPRKHRATMLLKIKELGPVFAKLGMDGVSTLLAMELKGEAGRAPRKPLGYRGVNFKDMRRDFILAPQSSSKTDRHGPAGYVLPRLTVDEGVLLLDEAVVERVAFGSKEGQVRWTRALPDKALGYEHGILDFYRDAGGMAGRGAVFISTEEDLDQIPEDRSHMVPFIAHKQGPADLNNKHVNTSPDGGFNARISADISIDNAAAADDDDHDAMEPLIDQADFWRVAVDSVEWREDEEEQRTNFVGAAQVMGNIGIGLWHSKESSGVIMPISICKRLDHLRNRINSTKPARLPEIGPLYERMVWVDEDGNTASQVKFTSATQVALLSNQARRMSDEELQQNGIPTKNLTFTNTI